jgi:tRNA-dihydrouridine synthase A
MSIKPEISPEISVAPMMDWTNRHCRYFHRLISPHALLYTEMVTTGALLHGDAPRFLRFDAAEHPVAFQLGGSDPKDLALCAKMVASEGFDEINLNCGCPSDRVQNGRFGACLMKEPAHVADCIAAMAEVVDIPVTVKCRIGIDEQDDFAFLDEFVDTIADKGCATFIVHARKAWLKGLSPKQNRDIPPLDYDLVMRMKGYFPNLHISINGGVETLDQALDLLDAGLDGVMIGRAAYHQPADILAQADRRVFGHGSDRTAEEAVAAMLPYIEAHLATGGRLHQITRHMLGLFAGRPGARAWRRTLSEGATQPGAGPELVEAALAGIEALALQAKAV